MQPRNRLIIWSTDEQPDHLHFQRYAREAIDAALLVTGQGLRFALQMAVHTPANGSAVLIAGGTRPPKPPIETAVQRGGTWAMAVDHACLHPTLVEVLTLIHEERRDFRLRAFLPSLLITTAAAARSMLHELKSLDITEPMRQVEYSDTDRLTYALLNSGLPDGEILSGPR